MSKLIENLSKLHKNRTFDDTYLTEPAIAVSGGELADTEDLELAVRWWSDLKNPTLHNFVIDQSTLPLSHRVAELFSEGIGQVIEISTVINLRYIEPNLSSHPQRYAARIIIGQPILDNIVEVTCPLCICSSPTNSLIFPKEYYNELDDPRMLIEQDQEYETLMNDLSLNNLEEL